jgi:cholesterol oxidase
MFIQDRRAPRSSTHEPTRPKRPLRAPVPDVHAIVTEDGTALRLTRYRGGDKGPVMLAHGLGVSSQIFALDTIETNLVEFLVDRGYDVWLLDFRSSIDLAAASTHYSGDEIATQDWPAAVASALELSGARNLQVVAHCWGAVTFTMAMLAGVVPQVRSAVISQVSAHAVTEAITRLKTGLHLPSFLQTLGVESLTAYAGEHPDWPDRLFDRALRLYPVELEERCASPVCRRITFMYAPLFEHDRLAPATHDHLHELFGVASMSAFEHLMRITNAGHVVGREGDEIYLRHLERMRIPICFLHGAENACFLPESTRQTLEALAVVNGRDLYARHEIPGYGHLDCIFGQDAVSDVYPTIGDHLDAF